MNRLAPPLLTLALVLLGAHAASQPASGDSCEFQGPARYDVVVEGLDSPIALAGAHALVRPTDDERSHVEVRDSLRFDATSVSDDVPFRLRRRVETGFDMFMLAAGERLERVRADSTGALTAKVTVALEVTARGLRVPCDAVTVDPSVENERSALPTLPMADGTFWVAVRRTMRIRPTPTSPDSILLHFPPNNGFSWQRVQTRGRFTRVVWSNGGTAIVGWVPTAGLRQTGHGGYGHTGGSGVGTCRMGRAERPGLRRGPAVLRQGASIRDTPEGRTWAAVASEEHFEVEQQSGARWTQIMIAPRISQRCGEMQNAWIRSDDVAFVEPS